MERIYADRKYIIIGFFLLIGLFFLARLFYVQILVDKINLGLCVTNRRDDGYHNIETLFYPLGFSDILEVLPNRNNASGTISIQLSGIKVDGPQDTNLVVRAYKLLNELVGLPAVDVYLHKIIPTGSGLGGGSSDGASILLILNKLFDLNLSYCELFSLAIKLGSDCPFFLDPIPSFARGRGEELNLAEVSLKGLTICLFYPGTGISTAAAYKHVHLASQGLPFNQMESLPVEGWKEIVINSFEEYAFEQHPVIGNIKSELYRSGAIYSSMTGSGSAVYGLFNTEPEIPKEISDYLIWKETF